MATFAQTDEKTQPFRRSTAVKRPLMRRSHIENFLGPKKVRLKEKLPNNTAICRFLLDQSLADLGGVPITESTPEGDDRIARSMASEVIAAINRDGHANAQHWYSDSLRKAVKIAALIHPELSDDVKASSLRRAGFASSADARTVFFAALAITSQNMRIPDNLRAAREQYDFFVKHGAFNPKGYGTKGMSIKANLEKFNHLVKIFDGSIAQTNRFLNTEFTMAEVTRAAAKVGLKINGGEMVDEPVYGSIVFGPKIGNGFFQNLSGNLKSLTLDLWATRTWGRWTGTLMKDSVSEEQVGRFVSSLGADRLIAQALKREGNWIELDEVPDLDNDDILEYARKVQRLWEGMRKALVAQSADNTKISARKAELDWPNAAEAIVKTLGHPVDQPGTRSKRRWIRNVTNRAIEILAKNGYVLEVAEVQALLWIPEKALYQVLGGRKVKQNLVSYDDAMAAVAKKEGISDDLIRAEIRSVEQDRARGQRDPGPAGKRDPFAVFGDDQGAHVDRRRPLSSEDRQGFIDGPQRPDFVEAVSVPAPAAPEPELEAEQAPVMTPGM